MAEPVQYSVENDVAHLHMDDGKANAYGTDMIAALSAGLDRAAVEAKAVMVSGRPGVLCAGYDLNIIRGDDAAARDAMRRSGQATLMKFYVHPQPVVLACTGHAVAAGALLLLTGDYRIGAEGKSKIGLNEVGIGLALPRYGIELARDRLSYAAVTQAILGAQIFDTQSAVAVGYLDEAMAPDRVLDRAMERAQQMAALDPIAFSTTKQRLRQPTIERMAEVE